MATVSRIPPTHRDVGKVASGKQEDFREQDVPAAGVAGCQVLCLCKSNGARVIPPPLEAGRCSIKRCWIKGILLRLSYNELKVWIFNPSEKIPPRERGGSIQTDKVRLALTLPMQGTSAVKY